MHLIVANRQLQVTRKPTDWVNPKLQLLTPSGMSYEDKNLLQVSIDQN